MPNDAQQVLDAFVWYYNRIFHKGINAIPYEVFHAYDINRQNIVTHRYPIYPVGAVVIRKPIRMGGYVPIGDFEPEPFVVNRVEGKLQGKYELRSLVTGELERRWYKPYEIREIPKSKYESLFYSPVLITYLRNKYPDNIVEIFLTRIVPSLMST